MGKRVELILFAIIVLIVLIALNVKVKNSPYKNISVSKKSSEINNFTEYEINASTILHTLNAKNAYESKGKWHIKDINISNKEIKSLTAKESVYAKDKIVLSKDVKAVKNDGMEYRSNKAIYKTKIKELITPNNFTIKRKVDIVRGKELIYKAKEKATFAKDVNGTFVLKK
jgi:hypothetical protein